MERVTGGIKRYLLGPEAAFAFRPVRDLDMKNPQETGLYVHIPFCKNSCPYCPYNKVLYNPGLVEPFVDALLKEIDEYSRRFGRLKISSVYIGGGTPTNLVDELDTILAALRKRFVLDGDICLETNPEDLNKETLTKLKGYGVDYLSIGTQSFNNRLLEFLGRCYRVDSLMKALDLAMGMGFKTVNLDLMFALPGQTEKDLEMDLVKAVASGAHQITTYPLFCFPYTTVGRFRRLKKVKMPHLRTRRRMYRLIHRYCLNQDFKRVSVWSFLKGGAGRYSSVTRDHYIGLGPGAGSHIDCNFYFNTFSLGTYIENCGEERLPLAITMDFTDAMERYFWLYWKFYDTYLPKAEINKRFGREPKVNRLLRLIVALGLATEEQEEIILSERGSFWLHLMQNYFALNYVNKIWTQAVDNPYPQEIRL